MSKTWKKITIGLFLLLLSVGLIGLSGAAQAQIVDNTSSKYRTGNYDLDDFIRLIITASQWLLGIVGSLSLIMFIYGGVMFLISAGSSDSVAKAKKIIIAAVIGLVIVFSSWLLIGFVLRTLNPNIHWIGMKVDINEIKGDINEIK
jgi:hypothetical protein